MRFRIYLKPFNEDGTYVDDWMEVTDDVDMASIGDLRQVLDDDTYDVGAFKFADFSIKFRNEHGRFSQVGELRTIFKYKRSDTLVRVTWQYQDFEPLPGLFYAGESIVGNDEIEVFKGLLSDEASDADIKDQKASFKVRGMESILARVDVPYADIANGDTVSELILAALDQARITDLLDVDALNINPTVDAVIDDITNYENATVKELMDDLLLISNSVLVVEDDAIIVKSREESADAMATFYGQASNNGIENIIDLKDVRTGAQKMFNTCTWAETSLVARDNDSVDRYGVNKKEFDFTQVTTDATRQDILDAFRDEFGQPKMTFSILVPVTAEMLALKFLDKVLVDYPTVLYPPPGEVIPIYGISIYGDAVYPFGAWSLTIRTIDEFKIMGKNLKTKNQHIEFLLRKV